MSTVTMRSHAQFSRRTRWDHATGNCFLQRYEKLERVRDRRYPLCMRGLSQRIMSMSPEDRHKQLEHASGVLRAGGCVVMPTETVYGVFVRASNQGAELMEQLTGSPQSVHSPRFTLHLADAEPIVPMLALESPVARRLVRQLLPGPVRLVLRQPAAVLDSICAALGLDRGLIDDGESIAIRLPDHPITRAVIRASAHPTLARSIGATRWGRAGKASDLESTSVFEAGDEANRAPGAVIDDGPTLHARGSTTIDIWPNGRFTVQEGGAIDEKQVMRVLTMRVIFVCTGNTCRSPMAQALGRDWARGREPDGLTLEIESAGIAAGEGYPAADQAIETMRERGIELQRHQSRSLTPEMIDHADAIFTMTPSHAQAVMQMAPGSVHKVFPIDPVHPIADPVGQPIEVYREVADQLRELVVARLEEMIHD